jgi:PAS domain S-box-containing protein
MPDTATQISVLHVDDDPGLADLTAELLERADDRLDVETATSVEGGLATVCDQPPDCVVSDYDMPGMDGLEFLQAVREHHPELPFILFTAKGSEAIASDAISAGVTDYLQKGSGTEQYELLVNRITNAVSAHEAEQRATERLQELQQILKTVPAAVLRVDDQGTVAFGNQRATELLGVASAAGTGRSYTDLPWDVATVDGDPVPDAETPFRRVLDDGDPVEAVRRDIVWPDGTRRTVEIHGEPLFDDGGAVESGVFSITDITDEVDRRRELERHETFLEYSPDFITVMSASGTIEYQSPVPEHTRDFDLPDLVGGSPREYIHPDDRDRAVAAYEQALAADSGEVIETEFRLRVGDGEYRWFASRATNYTGRDHIDGLLAATREITERKETAQALATYASTVTQLQDATHQLLETTDRREAAEITIDGLERAFEFDIAGLWLSTPDRTRLEPVAVTEQGKNTIEVLPTYSAERDSLSWEVFESGESRIVSDMSAHDDRHNPDTVIQSELIVPLGEYGLLNIGSTERAAFDERDRHRVELWGSMVESALARLDQIERLRERERELQRERDRLDEFASFVSHDLRNPLQVASGRLELATDDRSSPHLTQVARSLDRMDQLIEDVLDLARQGSTLGERESVDLRELLSRCWTNVEAPDADLVVDGACVVRADSSRLASAVENLFRNAVDHGGEAVTVTVGLLDDESGFYVADDGPGIPDGERERVFESGYSTDSQGTGLGLAIVRQVAEAHGWDIDACESADGGARFEITGVETVE